MTENKIRGTTPAPGGVKTVGIKEKQIAVSKRSYGGYASDNYGAHSLAVDIGSLTLYFSYDTVVAYQDKGDFHICKNRWGTTTGRHLNRLSMDKSEREDPEVFGRGLNDVLKSHGLEVSE